MVLPPGPRGIADPLNVINESRRVLLAAARQGRALNATARPSGTAAKSVASLTFVGDQRYSPAGGLEPAAAARGRGAGFASLDRRQRRIDLWRLA
jgi:hypothetical protein